MSEDATVYEYQIDPSAPHIVQIRAKSYHSGRGLGWREYMTCDSPPAAERIMALLVSDQATESAVRE